MLPNPPSASADIREVADFVEFLSLKSGQASKREVQACLGRLDDNENNYGCEDSDDDIESSLDDAMQEVERRSEVCGSGYPFKVELNGSVLRLSSKNNNSRQMVYQYLLLATRLNMKDHRVHSGIDGSLLFEEVSAHILRSYLGTQRARTLIFGTASRGGFPSKVSDLCAAIGEGGGFKQQRSCPTTAKDDKLDVVAWVPFSDGHPGQLILFAQCKTGSSWKEHTSKLQPDAFIAKWMKDRVCVLPVRTFCISEAFNKNSWSDLSYEAGIVFDRCRIIDFCGKMPTKIMKKIQLWTNAVIKSKHVTDPCERRSRVKRVI